MYIKKLQVFNYKSYFDSGVIEFAPGVNIIVGKNNAGKTSLLEVLTLDFEDHPHRSLKTLENKGMTLKEESKIEIIWEISTEEVRNFMKQLSPNLGIPIPKVIALNNEHEEYEEYHFNQDMSEALQQFKQKLEQDSLEIQMFLYADRKMDNECLEKLLNFESFPADFKNNGDSLYRIEYKNNEGISLSCDISQHPEDDQMYHLRYDKAVFEDSIGYQIFNIFKKRIYRFKAERLNIGNCKFENNHQLKSDASNLAEVLFILQGKKPGSFAQFNKFVSSILDEIKYISVVMGDDSEVEIKVWTTKELNRDDLSFPLSSCGSGVSQVLAIVYILVSSEEPRTLIIDEPQSFLHPGAAKKLIETIKQFPQHQYFIATHSPDIITTADPSNIIKLKYENCETTASVIHEIDIKSQKEILDELGVRLSDVFGADSVLWVEGPTEKKCFPLIIDKFLAEMSLKGMKILPVDSVSGLLDGKHTSLVARLHKQLTSGISLIPEKSIFIFDREGKTITQLEDLERSGFNFLERPMYENYILHSEAISAMINEEREKTLSEIGVENADSKWLKSPITSTQVQECFDKIQQEKQYLLKGIENDNWFFKVHGADVIQSVFQELCENQLDFNGNKPKYCLQITELIIKHQPDFLFELAEELKECLNKNK